MTEDVYMRLREFYDRLPGGFPESGTGVEIKILQKMYTPDEAEIVLNMLPMPEPASEIAQRAGKDTSEVLARLEDIAKRGLLVRMPAGDTTLFMILQFLIGAWEALVANSNDPEISALANEYLPSLAKEWSSIKTQQTRVVPVNSSVAGTSIVKPYDQIRELVATKANEKIVVSRCVCTTDTEYMGGKCEYPVERCINFGIGADYQLYLNQGREIDQEELSRLLDMGEKEGLVLHVNNANDIVFLCMCCHCCCVLLKMLRYGGRPGAQVQSSFYAKIDSDACTACGVCIDRCQINAVSEGDIYEIDTSRCIGCGLCVPTCPEDAITLIAKPEGQVFDNFLETQQQILVERGVA